MSKKENAFTVQSIDYNFQCYLSGKYTCPRHCAV